MRDVFSLGVRSAQLSESFNNALKNHLKSGFDIIRFLKHFERAVKKREKELQSEFEARKNLPRRLMCTPMLVQQAKCTLQLFLKLFKANMKDLWLHALEFWMEITNMLLLLGGCMVICILRRSA